MQSSLDALTLLRGRIGRISTAVNHIGGDGQDAFAMLVTQQLGITDDRVFQAYHFPSLSRPLQCIACFNSILFCYSSSFSGSLIISKSWLSFIMPQIKRGHDKAALLQHLCSDCKGNTSSRMDCKNLEKLMCFSCSRQDHYSGECNDTMRNGTPSLNKTPVPRKEVQTQIDELKTHCNHSLRLLRSCGFVEHADTLETHKPDPHGLREPCEASMMDLQPTYYDSSRKLTRLKQQFDAWRRYCLEIFEKIEQDGLAEAGMTVYPSLLIFLTSPYTDLQP